MCPENHRMEVLQCVFSVYYAANAYPVSILFEEETKTAEATKFKVKDFTER